MSLSYPLIKHTNEEIEILAEVWLESFINISPDVFKDAMRLHREASNYFPTVRDVLECCRSVWNERARNIKMLPEPLPDLTADETKKNVAKVREMIKKIGPRPINKTQHEGIRKRIKKYLGK